MSWEERAYSCSEMKNSRIIPADSLMNVLENPSVVISDPHDALMCILNALVIEAGFIPQIPFTSWKKKYFYSIEYTHSTTDNIICKIKYLRQEKSDMVHIFATAHDQQVAKYSLLYTKYIEDFTEKEPYKIYKNIQDLSVAFKDAIVWKMLAGAHDHLNINHVFGLSSLPIDVKLQILYKMGATELCRLSAVNCEFRNLVDQPSVWKCILIRDFCKYRDHLEGDWKELYKTEYAAKQHAAEMNRLRRRTNRFSRTRNPIGLPYPIILPWPLCDSDDMLQSGRFGPSRRQDLASVDLMMF